MRLLNVLVGVCLVALILGGCGGGPRPLPVSGSVKYKGSPLAEVNVIFYGPNNIIGRATTDSQGNFGSVSWQRQGDGLPAGTYKVTVVPKTIPREDAPSAPPPFPSKYLSMDTTPLEVTIQPPKAHVEIELRD